MSQMGGISSHRAHNPIKSKSILAIYALISCIQMKIKSQAISVLFYLLTTPVLFFGCWIRWVNFWLTQSERELNSCKADKIHNLTTIFTQNDNLGPFWVKIVVILWICTALQAMLSFSASEKLRDSTPNSQKLKHM